MNAFTRGVGVLLALLLSVPSLATAAEMMGKDEIIRALTPQPRTKPLTRGLTLEAKPAPVPSIDLQVEFEFDSDSLTPEARTQLDLLAAALTSPGLSGSRFSVAGHTDAKGGAAYNRVLSERRAQAVCSYLELRHGVPGDRLSWAGWGFARLKNPNAPYAAENRRVQISNIGR